jgi:hypothetical protein
MLHFEDASKKASTSRQTMGKPFKYGIGALGKLVQFYVQSSTKLLITFLHSEFDDITYLAIPQQFAIP